jgi:hypothetical protein
MKKRFFTAILVLLMTVFLSLGAFTSSADDFTEIPTEAIIGTEEPTEAIATEAETEEIPSESPTRDEAEEADGMSFDDIGAFFGGLVDDTVKHRDTILSALASFIASLCIIVMRRSVDPKVKAIKTDVSSGISAIKSKVDDIEGAQKKFTDDTERRVKALEKTINDLVESYKNERADAHAADAFAKICHEQSTLLHKVLVHSTLSPSVKEEADKIYADSERSIAEIEMSKTSQGET